MAGYDDVLRAQRARAWAQEDEEEAAEEAAVKAAAAEKERNRYRPPRQPIRPNPQPVLRRPKRKT